MTLDEVLKDINALQGEASFFAGQRRSDADLYVVLAKCLRIVEEVQAGGLLEDLKGKYMQSEDRQGRNRRFFEAKADAELVVGRLVFEGEGRRRDAAFRYTSALREAAKKEIKSADLFCWLIKNGGINALYRARQKPMPRTTKTLHLTSSVSIPASGKVNLSLQRTREGFFDVVVAEQTLEVAK